MITASELEVISMHEVWLQDSVLDDFSPLRFLVHEVSKVVLADHDSTMSCCIVQDESVIVASDLPLFVHITAWCEYDDAFRFQSLKKFWITCLAKLASKLWNKCYNLGVTPGPEVVDDYLNAWDREGNV